MAKRNKIPKTLETCSFICLSDLGISEQGMMNISESSDITFGDANRTLVTVERLISSIAFDEEEDLRIMMSVLDIHGPLCYIDLEN